MSLVVRGAIKDYDWGIIDGLARWAGEATNAPQAELWYGIHPGGPSPLVDSKGQATGDDLARHFDVESIPLLVKLLAAAKPLSVQVHPNKALAAMGYAAQQSGEESRRVYSDPFEKTELLVALQDFEAFAGWRDKQQAIEFLAAIEALNSGLDLTRAKSCLVDGNFKAALPLLIEANTSEIVSSLAQAAKSIGLDIAQVQAYEIVTAEYADDAGALITPLLAYLSLAKGEAVFLPAGVPHSYIRGIGVEVMTSSDNVVRLGLTNKPVFVDHALRAINDELHPQVMRVGVGDLIWPVNAPFVVRLLESGSERMPKGAYRIALAIEGKSNIIFEDAEITLRPGTAAVMSAEDPDADVEAHGLVAVIQSTILTQH